MARSVATPFGRCSRALALVASLSLALGVTAGATVAPAAAAGNTPAPTSPLTVAVQEVPQSFAAEATVEAVRQASVGAQVSGRVLELAVKAGDTVRAGQVLARIDSRTADQAVMASRSQVAEAEANLANAKRRHLRNQQLLAQKFVSQAAVDQSEAELKAAEAQVATMHAGTGQALVQQSLTTIVAPYAGVVGATSVEQGDMVTPGKGIATVFDPREMRVVATVPQSVLAKWQRDRTPGVVLPATGLRIRPTKVTVLPLADARAHTVRVRLDLPPTDGVLPGQYARAEFPTGTASAIAVPATAILRRGELSAVYVAVPPNAPVLRQVRTGETFADGRVEILAGLSAGERIFPNPVAAGLAPSGERAQ